MEIKSKNLTLRCWQLSDASEAFNFYGDTEVSKFIGDGIPLNQIASVEKVLTKFINHQANYGFSPWAIVNNQTTKIIGICGMHTFNEAKEMELGFRILRSEWGKGIATEASRLSLDFACSKFHPNYISAITDVENKATQKVLLKIGFKFVSETLDKQHKRNLLRFEYRK